MCDLKENLHGTKPYCDQCVIDRLRGEKNNHEFAAELGLTHYPGCSVLPCTYVRADGTFTGLADELRRLKKFRLK